MCIYFFIYLFPPCHPQTGASEALVGEVLTINRAEGGVSALVPPTVDSLLASLCIPELPGDRNGTQHQIVRSAEKQQEQAGGMIHRRLRLFQGVSMSAQASDWRLKGWVPFRRTEYVGFGPAITFAFSCLLFGILRQQMRSKPLQSATEQLREFLRSIPQTPQIQHFGECGHSLAPATRPSIFVLGRRE